MTDGGSWRTAVDEALRGIPSQARVVCFAGAYPHLVDAVVRPDIQVCVVGRHFFPLWHLVQRHREAVAQGRLTAVEMPAGTWPVRRGSVDVVLAAEADPRVAAWLRQVAAWLRPRGRAAWLSPLPRAARDAWPPCDLAGEEVRLPAGPPALARAALEAGFRSVAQQEVRLGRWRRGLLTTVGEHVGTEAAPTGSWR